jgi:hypothetical protein
MQKIFEAHSHGYYHNYVKCRRKKNTGRVKKYWKEFKEFGLI